MREVTWADSGMYYEFRETRTYRGECFFSNKPCFNDCGCLDEKEEEMADGDYGK